MQYFGMCYFVACTNTWPKQFKLWTVLSRFGSIVLVGVQTCLCITLKTVQMNVQRSHIWELVFYKCKLGYNTKEETKFGLVWSYGTSTIVGYLMPNPFLSI